MIYREKSREITDARLTYREKSCETTDARLTIYINVNNTNFILYILQSILV